MSCRFGYRVYLPCTISYSTEKNIHVLLPSCSASLVFLVPCPSSFNIPIFYEYNVLCHREALITRIRIGSFYRGC